MNITAGNYIPQAKVSLFRIAKMFGGTTSTNILKLIKSLDESVRFVVPDNGKILNDGLRGLRNRELNLPYPKITIEYFQNDDSLGIREYETPARKRIIYAEQFSRDSIIVSAMHGNNKQWSITPAVYDLVADSTWHDERQGREIIDQTYVHDEESNIYKFSSNRIINLFPEILDFGAQRMGKDLSVERAIQDVGSEVPVLLEFLEALTCSNVEIGDHKVPRQFSKKKGKKKSLHQIKTLFIKAPHTIVKSSGNTGRTHASPRVHLRRGHIRRLPSGNIWIQPCVVGNKKNGMVVKNYAIGRAN